MKKLFLSMSCFLLILTMCGCSIAQSGTNESPVKEIKTYSAEEYIEMYKNHIPKNCTKSADELIRSNYGSTDYKCYEENGKKHMTITINSDVTWSILNINLEIYDLPGKTNFHIVGGSITDILNRRTIPLSKDTATQQLQMIYNY